MVTVIYGEILNWILKKCNHMDWIHVACMREKRNAYGVLVGKPEGMRPPGRQRQGKRIILTWILMKYKGVDWIHVTHRHNW